MLEKKDHGIIAYDFYLNYILTLISHIYFKRWKLENPLMVSKQ